MKGKLFAYLVCLSGILNFAPGVKGQSTPTRVVNGRTFWVHIVGPKETLYGISRKYQVSVDTLYALNPGATLVIRPDQEILIPVPKQAGVAGPPRPASSPGKTHVVVAGETLYGLARKYQTTEVAIRQLNPTIGDYVKVGDVLQIPVNQGSVTQGQPTAAPVVERPQPTSTQTSPVVRPPVEPAASSPGSVGSSELATQDCGETFSWRRPMKVVLLLPFPEGNEGEIKLATEFYAGFKTAADYFSEQGLEIHLSVWNTGGSQDETPTRNLIKAGRLEGADLVVGPLYPTSLALVSSYAQTHHIPVVTPFSRSATLMDAARGVIKLTPSRSWVIQRTVRYFQRNNPQAQFILVDGQTRKDSLLVAQYKTHLDALGAGKYQKTTPGGVASLLKSGQQYILFFPTTREIAAKELMMKLNGLRNTYSLTLVGTEEWLEFSTVEVDYYENLQLHLPVAYQFHPEDSAFLDFRKQYRLQFGGEPGLASHRGYEVGMYFLYHLQRTGSAFPTCTFSQIPTLGGQFFQFAGNKNDGFENQSCRMMVFKNYQYQLVVF